MGVQGGVGPFDSDAAADWLAEFEEDPAGAVDAALNAFDEADDADGYIDTEIGSMIIAAAEAVATALGRPSGDIDLEVVNALRVGAVSLREADDARVRVLGALDRVEAGESELAEYWAKKRDGGEAWKATIEDVRDRLQ